MINFEYKNEAIPNSATEEAILSMNYAIKMTKSGNQEKALILFQRALDLAPGNPNILNSYGEYLERIGQNLMEADSYYQRALNISPCHPRALENHKRTLPLVNKLDECLQQNIARKKDEIVTFSGSDVFKEVSNDIKSHYVYHTVGIEGNTMTLAQTRLILESRNPIPDKSLIEYNEILGIDNALKYLDSTLLNKPSDISEENLLHIHSYVLGLVDPSESGAYRHTQVFVNGHKPPPPQEVNFLMSEFISWLNSTDARSLHPIKYAALAHFKLVSIHPFTDGNGRTSRLLMSLILMRAKYPLIIVNKEEKIPYFRALEAAQQGDVRPFIRYVTHSVEETLNVFLLAMSNPASNLALELKNVKSTRCGENVFKLIGLPANGEDQALIAPR